MIYCFFIPTVHLQSVNNRLKEVYEQRGLPVLSFGEGIPTTINNMLPKLTVSTLPFPTILWSVCQQLEHYNKQQSVQHVYCLQTHWYIILHR